MNTLLFEDDHVERLAPVTATRPAWSALCGARRLVEILPRGNGSFASHNRSRLDALIARDWPANRALDPAEPWTLCVNARLVPSRETARLLNDMANATEATVIRAHDRPGIVMLPTERAIAIFESSRRDESIRGAERNLGAERVLGENFGPSAWQQLDSGCRIRETEVDCFEYVHDYVRWNQAILADNLQALLSEDDAWREIADGVYSNDREWTPPDHVCFDTCKGPVLISEGCQIGPFSLLQGPLMLGKGNRVAEHAAIKEYVCTGTTCKIGGEVESTVMESWSNKQHHGFLGHSYLGSWINLGAGTCNSDLKNTYGNVNMRYGSEKVATGMQFLGCFIGDYAKTAINASIYTGKVIGPCSMVYGTVLSDVPPFVNYARSLGQVSEVDPHVMVATQARMFARRKRTPDPCDAQLILDLFESTRHLRGGLESGPLAW